ncbi:MAG: RloB domain-containing protein [Beduini sp.]
MSRKECRKYYFSVEGETEKWYLEWLENQINRNDKARYNVKLISKITKNPNKMVKQTTILGDLKIVHIFDFEDLQNESAFKDTLSAMKNATKIKKKVKYILGYSNYTFDLWIILHKSCIMGRKSHRSSYLSDINRCYNTQFESMAEYKEETNFKRLLNCLTLEDVVYAIANAKKIEQQNLRDYQKLNHCGYEYYRENPSLNLHEVIRDILKTVNLL